METLDHNLPPQSLEAEQAILGAVLIDNEAYHSINIEPSHFYRISHQILWDTFNKLQAKGLPIDLISVKNQLERTGKVDEAGGLVYLSQILSKTPTAANVRSHCNIVKDMAMRRDIQRKCRETLSFIHTADVDELLSILEVSDSRIVSGVKHIKEVAVELLAQIDERIDNKDKMSGIPTGFDDIDLALDGIQLSDLTLLAGRPGMGKSALAGAIARHAAMTHHVHKINFEMPDTNLLRRQLSSVSNINSWKLRKGMLDQEEYKKIVDTLGSLSQLKMTYEERPVSKLSHLSRAITRAQRRGAKMVVIDNLSLISNPSSSREREIGGISTALKSLAMQLQIAVLLICQLSRQCESRTDKRPMLSDLRDSGQVEQDADVVMFLYREGYYATPKQEDGEAEVILAKGRDIPTPTVKLWWEGSRTRFSNPKFRPSEVRGEEDDIS